MAEVGQSEYPFFIYDHEILKKEEDDPNNAVIYFYPPMTPINDRIALCGQLMGLVRFFVDFAGAPPLVYRLRHAQYVMLHHGKYSFALGGDPDLPVSVIKRQLDFMYSLFAFYHKNIEDVLELCSAQGRDFADYLCIIWDTYVPYMRYYGDDFLAAMQPVQSVTLAQGETSLFLKSSHLLEMCQRVPGVIAGCLLLRNRVLCSQLTPDFTARLALVRPHQTHLPCRSVKTDFTLPVGVRLLCVYVTQEEYDSLNPSRTEWPTEKHHGESRFYKPSSGPPPELTKADRESEQSAKDISSQKSLSDRESLLYTSGGDHTMGSDAIGTSDSEKILTGNSSNISTPDQQQENNLKPLQDSALSGQKTLEISEKTEFKREVEVLEVLHEGTGENESEVCGERTGHFEGDLVSKINPGVSSGILSVEDNGNRDMSASVMCGVNGIEALAGQISKDLVGSVLESLKPGESFGQTEVEDGQSIANAIDTLVVKSLGNNKISASKGSHELLLDLTKAEDEHSKTLNPEHTGVEGDVETFAAQVSKDLVSSVLESLNASKSSSQTAVADGESESTDTLGGISFGIEKISTTNESQDLLSDRTTVEDEHSKTSSNIECIGVEGDVEAFASQFIKDLVNSVLESLEKDKSFGQTADEDGQSKAYVPDKHSNISNLECTSVGGVVETFAEQVSKDLVSSVVESMEADGNSGQTAVEDDQNETNGSDTRGINVGDDKIQTSNESQELLSDRTTVEGEQSKTSNRDYMSVNGYGVSPVKIDEQTGVRTTDSRDSSLSKAESVDARCEQINHPTNVEQDQVPKQASETSRAACNVRVGNVEGQRGIPPVSLPSPTKIQLFKAVKAASKSALMNYESRSSGDAPTKRNDFSSVLTRGTAELPSPQQEHFETHSVFPKTNTPVKVDPVQERYVPRQTETDKTGNSTSEDTRRKSTGECNTQLIPDRETESSAPSVPSDNDQRHFTHSPKPPPVATQAVEGTSEKCEPEKPKDEISDMDLYIQGNADLLLLLVMEKGTSQQKDIIHALWKGALPQLGEMDLFIKQRAVKVTTPKKRDLDYNFLKYNSYQRTLKGNMLQPVSSNEHTFVKTSVEMHGAFAKSEQLTDIIFRSNQSYIYGHRADNQETFYHQGNSARFSTGLPNEHDLNIAADEAAYKKLLFKDNALII